jgi:hypothetical protein
LTRTAHDRAVINAKNPLIFHSSESSLPAIKSPPERERGREREREREKVSLPSVKSPPNVGIRVEVSVSVSISVSIRVRVRVLFSTDLCYDYYSLIVRLKRSAK